ncbi:Nif3-like dinuclear metal center hexameric protein [Cellulomonas fengjieae]|uniref:GTP cyclohydrolase 1 type 2 homolog n=1 Tax=Cellulomonas fengjieae TaxID=2819978 RepID=A0ABS3SE83_9CELL|nr:Nif3-like dinuclear metal center hexameric protein [Cellulomonas fengjieae]MBO3084061.1 Nif3-like dinuclear metal center hexameric protein [Cellulomonas fengjieae]MBO3103690.1 Nif3-like dinuclear metal center hexameric protein [Cellulomonas fengjieae]QVI64682.1 Nif3-like dinuclear metal center hexameric protein [Cellulomonas fengjieae]
MSATTLADVVRLLERRYPPSTAESWDAVGLVTGDPSQPVRRVLFAVDPVAVVADEAADWGADLVVTHHPLLLRPVHSIAGTTYKGALLHRLVRSGTALFTAHTNADAAAGGVNDALAAALGLVGTSPLEPAASEALDKHVVFVPVADAERLVDALAAAGAGAIGEYTRCAWTSTGEGTFTPTDAASPTIGSAGEAARVVEARVEMVAPRRLRASVVAALRSAHPYEEPAFDVLELASWPAATGTGRVGSLAEPTTLRAFASAVAAALPATAQGVRFAGDPDGRVERVAVVGGSGDSFFDAVRASGVDAYVTADLRHHPSSELRERARHDGSPVGSGTPYLVDVAHFASEWPWLELAARTLEHDCAAAGTTVETRVSTVSTDPWTGRVASPEPNAPTAPPEGHP